MIEFDVEKTFMHHPILSSIAHPNEYKKILENMDGQKLLCDDNLHRRVPATGLYIYIFWLKIESNRNLMNRRYFSF